MSTVLIGAYKSVEDASDAINVVMENDDVTPLQVSVLVNDKTGTYTTYLEENEDIDFSEIPDEPDAGEGAAIGALAGLLTGIGASLGAIALPGIALVGAGPLVAALTGGSVGTVTGAATGGLVAALVNIGVDEEHAKTYAETLEQGGALVGIEVADSEADDATSDLRTGEAVAVEEASEIEWQPSS